MKGVEKSGAELPPPEEREWNHPPELYEDLLPVWRAFSTLSRERGYVSTGMAAVPLPITGRAITDWLENEGGEEGIPPSGRAETRRMIRAMDAAYFKDAGRASA